MAAVWRLDWDNRRRETLWRLSVNGVAGAGGHGIAMQGPCKCGWAGPPAGPAACDEWRAHHFWACPVAAAVVAELQSALPARCPPLTCAEVWLLRAPPGMHPGVWGVVCAAALEAMERGRRALWALGQSRLDSSQTLITSFFLRKPPGPSAGAAAWPAAQAPAPPLPALGPGAGAAAARAAAAATARVVGQAQRRAAAWVWCILQDFAFLQGGAAAGAPAAWHGVPSAHPFLAPDGQGRLQRRLPPGLALPAEVA
jgi:hypothetical protein